MRLARPEATLVAAAADVPTVVAVGVDATAVVVAVVDTVGAGDVGTTKFVSSRLTREGSASGAPTMDRDRGNVFVSGVKASCARRFLVSGVMVFLAAAARKTRHLPI